MCTPDYALTCIIEYTTSPLPVYIRIYYITPPRRIEYHIVRPGGSGGGAVEAVEDNLSAKAASN
jgi:hypothetical protein